MKDFNVMTEAQREDMHKRMRRIDVEIAKHMVLQCLDYHEFDNGQMLVAEPDGIWLCHADETHIEKISNETWMISGINFDRK